LRRWEALPSVHEVGMYSFVRALKEFRKAYRRTSASLRVLDAVVLFLGIHLVLTLLHVPFILYEFDNGHVVVGDVVIWHALMYTCALSTLITSAGMVLMGTQKEEDVIRMLERRYVKLRDRLSCACDNRQLDNVFMRRLAREVDMALRGVSLSDFFYVERVLKRVGVLLAIVTVFALLPHSLAAIQMAGEHIESIGDSLGIDSGMLSSNEDVETKESTTAGSALEGGSEVLYGQARLAEIKGAALDLTIYSGGGSEVLVRDTNTTEQTMFNITPQYPVDVESYEVYSERLPSEHIDIVRRYFEMLTERG